MAFLAQFRVLYIPDFRLYDFGFWLCNVNLQTIFRLCDYQPAPRPNFLALEQKITNGTKI